MTGDVMWHGGGLSDIAGPENLAGLLGSFIGALPDLHVAEQDIIAENDLVVVRLVVTGTVKGSLPGVPADDVAAIMAQIGAFNPPWAA